MTSQSLSIHAQFRTSLLQRALATDPRALAPLALRATLALVMFPHGAQKAFGWFGGYGWNGTMGFLTGQIGMPTIGAAGVILLELLGPVLLLVGLGTRFAAAGFVALMLGAIATVHGPVGFFMNWTGTQAGEGYEYHLLAIGAALALVLTGGGRLSADARLQRTGPR